MLKNLLELVKENAGDAIINNAAVPNAKNNAVIQTATNSLFKALQNNAKQGGLNNIKELLEGRQEVDKSPVIGALSSSVAGDLMKKFKLDKGAANSIVAMLIPVVLSRLVKKTNDPNDSSFNLDGIIGALAGGRGGIGGLLGSLKNILGK